MPQQKTWLKFDFTINLPLILTLVIGFGSVCMTVVKLYYDHDLRINNLEIAEKTRQENEKKFDPTQLVTQQAVITTEITHLKEASQRQTDEIGKIGGKIDTIIQRGRN
jgi:hypothetical protein